MKPLRSILLYAASVYLVALPAGRAEEEPETRKARIFAKADHNGDGTLTSDEIGPKQQTAFRRLLRVGDENQDGRLTREEYLKALEPQPPVRAPSQARRPGQGRRPQFDPGRLLRAFDRDNDKKLTLDELPERFRERLKPAFERLDKDALSADDLRRLRNLFGGPPDPAGLFRRLDQNGDDKLARGEVPAFLRRRLQPVFERVKKDELSRQQFIRAMDARPNERNRRALFDRLDRDDDGKLTLEEVPAPARERLAPIFERLGKKSISRDEFIAASARNSRQTDRQRRDE